MTNSHSTSLISGLVLVLMVAILTACSSAPHHGSKLNKISSSAISATKHSNLGSIARKGGGYYLDDGPGDNPPSNLHLIPNAVPKVEQLRLANMQPYVALGKNFIPMTKLQAYKERGIASWYGRRYHGNHTASGEKYDMYAMTAAHPTLPLPSYARVTNLENGKSIIVRLNDRGPFLSDRVIDLSYTAAYKLGILAGGSGQVEVESILPDNIQTDLASTDSVNTASPVPEETNQEINLVYLQLGAFGSSDNAQNFLTQVRKKIPWFNKAINITKNNGLYKIHAGPYPDPILAKQAANTITPHLAVTPIIVVD